MHIQQQLLLTHYKLLSSLCLDGIFSTLAFEVIILIPATTTFQNY